MGLFFWKRNKVLEAEKQHLKQRGGSYVEVLELKRKTHKAAEDTAKDIERLNRLLQADGITLEIHIATGAGRHGGR
jgi:hypothetical protein